MVKYIVKIKEEEYGYAFGDNEDNLKMALITAVEEHLEKEKEFSPFIIVKTIVNNLVVSEDSFFAPALLAGLNMIDNPVEFLIDYITSNIINEGIENDEEENPSS